MVSILPIFGPFEKLGTLYSTGANDVLPFEDEECIAWFSLAAGRKAHRAILGVVALLVQCGAHVAVAITVAVTITDLGRAILVV